MTDAPELPLVRYPSRAGLPSVTKSTHDVIVYLRKRGHRVEPARVRTGAWVTHHRVFLGGAGNPMLLTTAELARLPAMLGASEDLPCATARAIVGTPHGEGRALYLPSG